VDQLTPPTPPWVTLTVDENAHLSDLMTLASTNFGRHLDWFQRHRDMAVKNIAAILAAETALVGLGVAQKQVLPAAFALALLLVLSCAAPVLAWLGIRACRQAYRAAMESAFMMAKVAWTMGALSVVAVKQSVVGNATCPGYADLSLYAPRWTNDCVQHRTTDEFVAATLSCRTNTCFLAKVTILVFGSGACALGLLGVGLIMTR